MSREVIPKFYSMISGKVRCRSCNTDFPIKRKGQNLIEHSQTCREAYERECKRLTTAIAAMIIRDLKPLSLVDDAAFKSFIHSFDSDYNIPPQAKFLDTIIPEIHDDMVQRLQANINKEINEGKMAAAFAIDTWTSVDSFMSVSVHYITECFKVYSWMLAVELLPKNYTDESVHDALLNILKTWKFNNRLPTVFCTTNSMSIIENFPAMSTMWTPVPCFDAFLQSAVISVLKEMRVAPKPGRSYSKLVKKCMRIIRHFSVSVSARRMLTEICSTYIVPVKLIEKVDTTCWISVYTMFKCLIQLRGPLTDHTLLGEIENLNEAEWTFIVDVANVLELIKETTKAIYTEKYPTLSLHYPTYCVLKQKLADSDENSELKQNILLALRKQFKGSIGIDAKCATLLDPRFKDKPFKGYSAVSAKQNLRKRITELCKIKPEKETKFNKLLDQELEEYWPTPIDKESNIINWWHANSKRYPRLATAAKHFLVIPAVRVSDKRFLAPRSIIQKYQTNPPFETMQKLCILHANDKLREEDGSLSN
ncbi:E3 SUMO-protein ligase ZBED1-like [Augochlora pura]